MPCFFPPDDGGFGVSCYFAGELDHLARELGGVLRAFEDAWFGADDEASGSALPRPDDVVGETLEHPRILGADVRDDQVALVLDLDGGRFGGWFE